MKITKLTLLIATVTARTCKNATTIGFAVAIIWLTETIRRSFGFRAVKKVASTVIVLQLWNSLGQLIMLQEVRKKIKASFPLVRCPRTKWFMRCNRFYIRDHRFVCPRRIRACSLTGSFIVPKKVITKKDTALWSAEESCSQLYFSAYEWALPSTMTLVFPPLRQQEHRAHSWAVVWSASMRTGSY